MTKQSLKRQQFFKEVLAVQNGEKSSSPYVTKIANFIGRESAQHFANASSEKIDLKEKKAIVATLKDIVEPMYLDENEETDTTMDPVSTSFHKKEVWAKYVRMYVGQPLSPKEVESLGNFKEKKPTKIARTEIWYNTTDSFGSSHTSVIKKMKDSGEFSFVAFQKQERVEPEKEEEPGAEDMGGAPPDLGGLPMGGEPPLGGTTPMAPMGEQSVSPQTPPTDDTSSTTTSTGTVPSPEEKEKQEKEKDDIIVTKSILFKDEIKGAAILVEFLKKLNL